MSDAHLDRGARYAINRVNEIFRDAREARKARQEETMTEPTIPDRYLGDGVYASFDGYHIFLDLRAQDNTTRIGLEPEVLAALDRYRAAVVAAVRDLEVQS